VRTRLCVRVVIDDVVVPDLGPNESGTLTVVAGVSFAGGPTMFTPSVAVVFGDDPGGPGVPASGTVSDFTRTASNGQASFPVTATASGVVRYKVCSVVHPDDFNSLFASLAGGVIPCRSSVGGMVVTPSQTTIAPGASRQFTAVVEDTDIQDVTWAVSGGGSITQTGLFTSNGNLGTFFVTATSVADPDSVGIAQVTVADQPQPPPPPHRLPRPHQTAWEPTTERRLSPGVGRRSRVRGGGGCSSRPARSFSCEDS
jgi:hypothetical protein